MPEICPICGLPLPEDAPQEVDSGIFIGVRPPCPCTTMVKEKSVSVIY